MITSTAGSARATMTTSEAGTAGITGTSPLARLRERAREVTVPSMGEILFDPDRGHAYDNFLIAAGAREGSFRGLGFMDGDFYKWLEAAVTIQHESPSEDLASKIEAAVTAIIAAQRDDGYLQTKTLIAQRSDPGARPFAQRADFETYNAGHLMTLACVHHRLTGDSRLMDVALRFAQLLRECVENQPDLLADCNICPSHYMGVIELYRETSQPWLLELARGLLGLHGGKGLAGSDDNQDVLAVDQQSRAVGHAVRANYLYAGMADVALEVDDEALVTALESIWADVTSTKLYVTGGCGALYDGASPDGGSEFNAITLVHQAYGRPHQLPQASAYNESCASLGLLFLAWRMLLRTGRSTFADEIERVLYNALPAAIGADGRSYFYTNPLRQVRDLSYSLRRAGDPPDAPKPGSHERGRQEFMKACFCCPPNIGRVIAELPYYVYTHSETDIWVHQFISGTSRFQVSGVGVEVTQTTAYPQEGEVNIRVRTSSPAHFALRVRMPGWADSALVLVDGEPPQRVEDGYAVLARTWHDDVVTITLPLRPRLTVAHRLVEEASGQTCVVRGPVVYCLESADLPDDVGITEVAIPDSIDWTAEAGEGIFAGHTLLAGRAQRLPDPVADGVLYADVHPQPRSPIDVRLVPYALWGNRGAGEMSVWLPLLRTFA